MSFDNVVPGQAGNMDTESEEKIKSSLTYRIRKVYDEKLEHLGAFIARKSCCVMLTCLMFLIGCTVALAAFAEIETDLAKLWVEKDGTVYKQSEYTEEHKTDGWASSAEMIIFTAKDDGNAMTKELLMEIVTVMEEIQKVTVKIGDTTYSLGGIDESQAMCEKVPLPPNIRGLTAQFPCVRVQPLDCFKQGGYDAMHVNVLNLVQGAAPELEFFGFENRVDLETATPDEIGETFGPGCQPFTKLITFDVPTLIGGLNPADRLQVMGGDRLPDGKIVHGAKAFRVILLSASPKLMQLINNVDPDEAEEAYNKWTYKLADKLEALKSTLVYSKFSYMTSNSVTDLVKKMSAADGPLVAASYGIMTMFIIMNFYNKDRSQSLVQCGLIGLLFVILATSGGIGFYSLLGFKLNATILQVLPFVALGLGVNDMFIYVHVYKHTYKTKRSPEDVISEISAKAGANVTLTSAANACGFFIGALIPIPAISDFCIAAGAVVVMNYLAIVFGLQAALARQCAKSLKKSGSKVGAEPHAANGSASPSKASKPAATHHKSLSSLEKFCVNTFVPTVEKAVCKAFILLLFCALLGVSILGITKVEVGLEVKDMVPSSSPLFDFFDDLFKYYTLLPSGMVIGQWNGQETFDFSLVENQKLVVKFIDGLNNVDFVVKDTPDIWLNTMIDFVNETAGLELTDDGWIPEDKFYEYYELFVDQDGEKYLDAYLAGVENFGYENHTLTNGSEVRRLIYSSGGFTVDGMYETQDYIDMINAMREYLDTPEFANIPAYPSGYIFVFWEQYMYLEKFFWLTIELSVASVFVVTLLILLSPGSAFFVAATSAVIVAEIFGLLSFFDMKFSGTNAVTLIMSIGIAVEFTAHLVHGFEGAIGDRNTRMRLALQDVFVPVLQGGVSSFLGFSMMAFSEFQYIVKYFFGLYTIVIVVGLLNGLVFLPVILSFIGPVNDTVATINMQKASKTGRMQVSMACVVDLNASDGNNTTPGAGGKLSVDTSKGAGGRRPSLEEVKKRARSNSLMGNELD